MGKVNKTIYKASTVLLVIMFAITGLLKISPAIYAPAYNDLLAEFTKFVHIPPVSLLHLQPTTYMLIVGFIEVTCAGVIAIGKFQYGKLATWILGVVMLGAIYTLFAMSVPLQMYIPACVCLGLVVARLYTMGALHQVEVKVKL